MTGLAEGLAHVRGALQARVHVRAELLAILDTLLYCIL